MLSYLTITLVSAFASLLANKNIAVFNDGLRPVVPEFVEGRIDKKGLATTSFAMSFGLLVGFGIPISIATKVLLVHSILLGTDIIGTFFPSDKKGSAFAFITGGAFGFAILKGLQVVIDIFAMLPVDFLPAMALIGKPVMIGFAVFPALVIGGVYGAKKGFAVAIATGLFYQTIKILGSFNINGYEVVLEPIGMSLAFGMVVMLAIAVREKNTNETDTNQQLLKIFSERVKRIKANIVIIAITGGLIAVSSSLAIMAEGPISQALLSEARFNEATIASFARALGFIPLVATTAIATGVYSPAGMKIVFVVGLLLINQPILAFFGGALAIALEVLLLNKVAVVLDKSPGIRKCGDYIRTATNKVLEISLLAGGAMACYAIDQNIGMLVLVTLYTFNKIVKKPLVEMVVGPVAAILTGILVNILAVLQGVL